MKIIRFTQRNLNAWLNFFDKRAFSDHKEWKTCYCTYYYYPRFDSSKKLERSRREYAKWLIENNLMNGYLVFEGGKAIGWCNVGPKKNYPKLVKKNHGYDGIKSIVCFVIEKGYRGKGIAKAILKRIIKDSKKDDTKRIEAYPNLRAKNEFSHYHGPVDMYLKEGFEMEKSGNSTRVKLML
jgi:GNAT superfamily N-acetyltransferase